MTNEEKILAALTGLTETMNKGFSDIRICQPDLRR